MRRHDQFRESVQALIDMPDRTTELLLRFLRQGNGRLSGRARQREFAALTDKEAEYFEKIYADIFQE